MKKSATSKSLYLDEYEESTNSEIAKDATEINKWVYSQKWSEDDGSLDKERTKRVSAFEKKHNVLVRSDSSKSEKKAEYLKLESEHSKLQAIYMDEFDGDHKNPKAIKMNKKIHELESQMRNFQGYEKGGSIKKGDYVLADKGFQYAHAGKVTGSHHIHDDRVYVEGFGDALELDRLTKLTEEEFKSYMRYIPKSVEGYSWMIDGVPKTYNGLGVFDTKEQMFTNINSDKKMTPYIPLGGAETTKEIVQLQNSGAITASDIYVVPHIVKKEKGGFIELSQTERKRLDELQIREDNDILTESENKEYVSLVEMYRKTKDYKGGSMKNGGSVKSYKLGNKWSNDFDYDGMLEMGLKADMSWDKKKLRSLFDSYEDVNYHSVGKHLWEAIISEGEAQAKESIEKFHSAIREELGFEEHPDTEKLAAVINSSLVPDNIKALATARIFELNAEISAKKTKAEKPVKKKAVKPKAETKPKVAKKTKPTPKPKESSSVTEWKEAVDSLKLLLKDKKIHAKKDVKEWEEAVETLEMLIAAEKPIKKKKGGNLKISNEELCNEDLGIIIKAMNTDFLESEFKINEYVIDQPKNQVVFIKTSIKGSSFPANQKKKLMKFAKEYLNPKTKTCFAKYFSKVSIGGNRVKFTVKEKSMLD